jgi:hypothetical protein
MKILPSPKFTPKVSASPVPHRALAVIMLGAVLATALVGCCGPTPNPDGPGIPPGTGIPPATNPPVANIPVPPVPPAIVTPHPVDAEKELIIRDLRVVESDRATRVGGPWHIGTLLSNMAPANVSASAFTLRWLRTWESPQTVENNGVIPPRPGIRDLVINPWLGSQVGQPDSQVQLDWNRAPFRLLAIVSRTDLAKVSPQRVESAGEGRFVFGVLDSSTQKTLFTVIFEYSLQANSLGQIRDWAKAWHHLGTLPNFDETYLATLQRITDAYAGGGIAPSRVNGSALNQLRTDEIALAFPWELREFGLSTTDGSLKPTTVQVTPDISFNGTATLAAFLTANRAAILATNHAIPQDFQGASFRAAASLNDKPRWNAPGFENGKVRFLFGLATCSGCHGVETGLAPFTFTHIDPRDQGQVAPISDFLTDAGASIDDPEDTNVPPRKVFLSDLRVRKDILARFANINPAAAGNLPELIRLLQTRKNRVH